jgi:hypothetical protein
MANAPHKHHFIPIFYSKAWAGQDGQVVRFTKPYRSVIDRRVHPAAVGWEEGLYTIPDAPAEREQALEERFFKQLDNVAAVAHRKLIANPQIKLDGRDLTAWSTFIMSLLHRSPEHLRSTKEAGKLMWRRALEELRDTGRATPEAVEEYLSASGSQEDVKAILRNLPALISNPNIGQFLNDCHWIRVPIPADEIELLLSDDPLARTNGLRTEDGHVAMPLSPRHFLVAGYKRETVDRIGSMKIRHLVKNMNKWTVSRARHFVVASDTSQAHFIERHFGTDPIPGLLDHWVRTGGEDAAAPAPQ